MLLLECRTPIKGFDNNLKISMSNQSTWTAFWSPIESKFFSKKWNSAFRGVECLFRFQSHFENFYVEPQHRNDWLEPD